MRYIQATFVLTVLLSCTVGCQQFKESIISGRAVENRELVYSKPMDYTYLNALDAITAMPDWEIYETDKSIGMISALDNRYKEAFNPDDRVVTIWLTAAGRKKTSIKLAKASEGKLRAHEILDAIDMRMSRLAA